MTTINGQAPAKINLTLHVTGQRDDGYHLLDSLVVFADIWDDISVAEAPGLHLSLSGPGSAGVPADESNLVMKAARALQETRGVTAGAEITLHKALPSEAGIGGGSSDAAATLNLLAELWDVAPLSPNTPEVVALGADVPVCMRAPSPVRMTGIGDILAAPPSLPECALVLVNPGVAVPTNLAFDGLQQKSNRAMQPVPADMSFDDFAAWLSNQRNDLLTPALKIAPEIEAAVNRLRAMPQVKFVSMSGSGSTCFGLTRNMADARHVARAIQLAQQNWWVAPGAVLK